MRRSVLLGAALICAFAIAEAGQPDVAMDLQKFGASKKPSTPFSRFLTSAKLQDSRTTGIRTQVLSGCVPTDAPVVHEDSGPLLRAFCLTNGGQWSLTTCTSNDGSLILFSTRFLAGLIRCPKETRNLSIEVQGRRSAPPAPATIPSQSIPQEASAAPDSRLRVRGTQVCHDYMGFIYVGHVDDLGETNIRVLIEDAVSMQQPNQHLINFQPRMSWSSPNEWRVCGQ